MSQELNNQPVGADEIYLSVLKELADEVAKPISIKFEHLWQTCEISSDWKREN